MDHHGPKNSVRGLSFEEYFCQVDESNELTAAPAKDNFRTLKSKAIDFSGSQVEIG